MRATFGFLSTTLALAWMVGCSSVVGNDDQARRHRHADAAIQSDTTVTGDSGTSTDSGTGGGIDSGTVTTTGDGLPAPLRTISVDTMSALQDALANAQPGDWIQLRDQTWTFSSYVSITRSGTAAHPIVISAETIGGAVIAGSAGFRPSSVSYVVVRGFDFRFSAGASVGIDCRSCSFVRFSRNHFELAPVGYTHWLELSGVSHDNHIDHNVFINKATEGDYFVVDGTTTTISSHNLIEWNYFANQTWSGANNGECMRVGWSALKYSQGYNIVQNNLFEHCDGDPEVVSVKSSNEVIRYNTFRNNHGALVFRHGDASQAIGNFFFGNDGGIRVYGNDHRIVNNYFEGNTGTGSRASVVIGGGTTLDDAPLANDGYDDSQRVVFAFNTLANNASQIQIGNTSTDAYAPMDCTIADNLLVGSAGTFAYKTTTYSGFTWAGNMLSGSATTGVFPSGSYTRTSDPKLVSIDGFLHLASDSPAVNAASGTYSLTDDSDGQPRSGAFDIGADEYATGASTRRPLQASDVGPSAP